MSQRIVIIGAGPGGLAAALLLRARGCDVTVLERSERVGGRTRAIVADGFRFDAGPTFFLYPRILEEILATVGRRLADEIDLIRLDPHYHLIFEAGGELRATGNRQRMMAEISRLSPADAVNLPRYLDDNRAKLAAFRPVLESPFQSPLDLLRPSALRAMPRLRPFSSVDGDLKRYFSDPRVRQAFSFQAKYLGMSPFRCPSLFTILAFLEYEHGVFHPRGGCAAVIERLADIARAMGVRIQLNEPVTELEFTGRRATAARTPRGAYACDALVINADFAQAMRTLVPDDLRRRWTDARLAGKRFSCSTFMMYLGIEGRFDHLDHHTIVLPRDYEGVVQTIEAGDATPDNPAVYVQNACVTDPELAPPGHSTLYVLAPVAHETAQIDWRQERARFRARLIERLAAIGIDDLERRIRFEKVLTPSDWADEFAIHRGATFNLAHSWGQMLHLRPNNRFEDLDGVYLVGGGTHPGSGLPVIFESARITSGLMAEDLDLHEPGVAHPDAVGSKLARAS